MSENRFIDKFQHKTDTELEYILDNRKNYNEQAVSASIQILKGRNGQSVELKVVENEIIAEKEIRELNRRKVNEEEKKKSNLTDDPNAPELYSKRLITIFSGIFSTIFGAVLLAYNLKEMGNKKGRNQVLIFGIIYTIISLVIINLLDLQTNLALIFNFAGAGILTEYFWNKFLDKDIKHRKRSWIKPAIISGIIIIPFVLALIYKV